MSLAWGTAPPLPFAAVLREVGSPAHTHTHTHNSPKAERGRTAAGEGLLSAAAGTQLAKHFYPIRILHQPGQAQPGYNVGHAGCWMALLLVWAGKTWRGVLPESDYSDWVGGGTSNEPPPSSQCCPSAAGRFPRHGASGQDQDSLPRRRRSRWIKTRLRSVGSAECNVGRSSVVPVVFNITPGDINMGLCAIGAQRLARQLRRAAGQTTPALPLSLSPPIEASIS